MITWMQTHKKWLIITIWIATIAFIGAGFVGWGAYSYGKKQDEVARVKDTSIRVKDIQTIYSNMFNQLNQMMGGKLDEATAEQFGLKKAAFNEALKRAMLIQFAKDNGLYVTDEQLAQELLSIPAFQRNGKFSKKMYKMFLANAHLTPEEFENNLKKDMLVQKILKAISLPATPMLIDTIGSLMFMEDKLTIKTIQAPKISVTPEELQKYYQLHKEQYKSKKDYDIGYYYVPLNAKVNEEEMQAYYQAHDTKYTDENGKILPFAQAKDKVKFDLLAKKTKREAIITMKKLKKGQMKFNIAQHVGMNNTYIEVPLMQKLIQTKFLKPTLTPKGWLIAKLIKVNLPTVLPYDKAEALVKAQLLVVKRINALKALAKQNLDFKDGIELGYVGRDDVNKIKSLSIDEAVAFLQSVFNHQTPKGFVLLPAMNPSKAVLYHITEQKLLDKDKFTKHKNIVIKNADTLKGNALNTDLIKALQNLYQTQIKIFMKI
ncbi:MAG: hypothetical protein GXO40_02055 [Epsilonproteobacteria bacterium]|nr:hypothetical protein [Campylobacterota bacterium]